MAEIILTIVVQVVKCLAPPACRQISYLRESKYTSNLQNLKTEVNNLKSEKVRTEHRVDEAKSKGEEIEKDVENCLAEAKSVIEGADNFTKDEATANKRCFKGLCPNLKTRRRLSKEAERQKEAIVKVREAGGFDSISYSIIPEDTLLMSNKDYEAFESRMSILNEITDALKSPDISMLGIYGMGGVGKTTLAKEVARRAENDKLFDQVVFSEVSDSQDIRKIQGEIADKLRLRFAEETESGRSRKLYRRLKEEKRILVILDNIWENLDLKAVGIPHGDDHKGCKVLLTARSIDTLTKKMDSQQNFLIGALGEEEAWSLFKKMAGDYVEGSEFKWVAKDVANECAGLPVSIVTVARALRNNNSLFDWKDALEQLRRPSSTNFMNIQPAAYKAVKLSYDKLVGEELKSIFLLIGYTAIASIDDLLMCGVGLGLFQGVSKMEVARARVHALVHKLKASCMLLDHISQRKGLFSMHDVVRDVAISIASTEQNVFSATNELVEGYWEWSDESATKLYTSIVLHDIRTNLLPEVVECPHLKLLFICADKESSSLTIPNNFFERMIRLRIVNLTDMFLQSLPSSLGLLSNLRTLSLRRCSLLDISVVGDLKKLEILCLRGSEIEKLPVEVGELTWLKLLDLRECWKLEVIQPNILSKLSHLEELYISGNFDKWGVEVQGVKNASLEELKRLPNLAYLELDTHDVSTLPRGLILEKLERYSISIGNPVWAVTNIRCRELSLGLNNKIPLKGSLIVQLQRIEDLGLMGLQQQDVDYFRNELVKVGSSQLKRLYMSCSGYPLHPAESKRSEESANDLRSHEIMLEDNAQISNALFTEKVALPNLEDLSLVSINVERIWQNQVAVRSCGVQSLTHLTLHRCWNLRCLFPSSTVGSFVRLQSIEIRECPLLEELTVMDNQEERKNNIVAFPQLQYLWMDDLEKFTSFCTGDIDVLQFPSLKILQIHGCPEFVAKYKRTTNILTVRVFPNLEELQVDANYIVTNKNLFSEDLLYKIKCLSVEFVDARTILSLGDFLQRFHTMKVLEIQGHNPWLPKVKVENGMGVIVRVANDCYHLKHILIEGSSVMNNLVFLRVMECDHLVNLLPPSTSFQNLTNLMVSCCKRLKIVLTSSIAKTLVRLRYMAIESCNSITEIVLVDDVVAKDEAITFRELKELTLLHLESLTSFSSGNCAFKFPSLEKLIVDDCPDLKIFSEGKLSTPNLHKVQRRGKACWAWKDDLNTTIQKTSFPTMVAGVLSDDSGLQVEAATWFRNLLSIGSRLTRIEKVIQSGVVPRFVEFLTREDNPQLQFEAVLTLTNIASGTSENIKVLIHHGAVPIFVKLLACPSDDLREQAAKALGNVAGSSPTHRDLVLSEEALIPLLAQLNEQAKISMLTTAARTLSNFCGGKPQPPFDQVRPALPALAQLVRSNDWNVLYNACEALACLSDGTNDQIQAVVEADVCPGLVQLLGHSSVLVLIFALETVGNILKGDEFHTQCIIDCGALPYLLALLIHNYVTSLRKEACWAISNITAGKGEQIQAVIDAGLIGPLVNLLQNAEIDTKKEAARAISNATVAGSHEQIKYLVREGCTKALCDLLLCADPEVVAVCLKGLENILKVGEAETNTGTAIGDINQYARLVEEAEGFRKIEDLKSHDRDEIREKAVKILDKYWSGRVIGKGE